MTTRLASLEAALEQLALEFAEKLLATAISAPVSELSTLLREGSALPRSIARAPRSRALAPAPTAQARTRFDEVDETDAFANAITDPSLLLEVIGSGRSSATRDPKPEIELLGSKAPTSEQGPTLRPGESLQRTAGGGVVLRRGAR